MRFAVRRGDVKDVRLDVGANSPVSRAFRQTLAKTNSIALADLITLITKGETPLWKGDVYQNDGIAFLKAQNISEDGIQGELNFITQEVHERMKRSQLLGGEILYTMAGTVGVATELSSELAPANINQAIAKIVVKADVYKKFLVTALNSTLCRQQAQQSLTVSSQPNINFEQIKALLIPFPPLETQRVLVNELEAARQSRRDKIAQADALLSSLDGWLLDQLGLQPPREEKRACFAVRLGDVRSRFDADFHSPRFQALRTSIENSGSDVVSVKEVAVYVRSGFASGRDDQADDAESGVPHIRPMNITPQGEFSLANAKFVPRAAVSAADWLQKGEVIFNNTNSTAWVGKTGVFAGETECACSNHIAFDRLIRFDVNELQ